MQLKKGLVLLFFLIVCSFSVSAFWFNGTVYDNLGNLMNYTFINVTIYNGTGYWIDGYNFTNTSLHGGFSFGVNESANWYYKISLEQRNISGVSFGAYYVDYIGQSIPDLPRNTIVTLTNTTFYLARAGTFNITVVNASGHNVPFYYQVKEKRTGQVVSEDFNLSYTNRFVYVPMDKNYTIMVYPQNNLPASYEWTNFSAVMNYNQTLMTKYNITTRTLHKEFNVTPTYVYVYGWINSTPTTANSSSTGLGGTNAWENGNFTVFPFLMESGNIVHLSRGVMPFNMTAWVNSNLNDTFVGGVGFYNITLPALSNNAESNKTPQKYLLMAIARNKTYWAGFRNVSVARTDSHVNVNFTAMAGLFGDNTPNALNFTTRDARNWDLNANYNTTKQAFRLVNANNQMLGSISAHIEVKLNYTSYGVQEEFTFVDDIRSSEPTATFWIPLLNTTGVKEMNIYSPSYAPKSMNWTVARINANSNITMNVFNATDIAGTVTPSDVTIYLYRSNSTCDVPNPPTAACLLKSYTMATFSNLATLFGGGKVSLRAIKGGNVYVHLADVNLVASGPSSVYFDANPTTSSSGSVYTAGMMRFGSDGPKSTYDSVLVGMPYSEGANELDESQTMTATVPYIYDNNWNTAWYTDVNGRLGRDLAGNLSHYEGYLTEWETLMNTTTCQSVAGNATWFNLTIPCYVNKSGNIIWVRLPHLSGVKPKITGTALAGVTTGTSDTGGGGGGGAGGASSQTATFDGVAPGINLNLAVTNFISPVKELNVMLNKDLVTVKLKVSGVTQSVKDSLSADGLVYDYFSVDKTGFVNEDIDKAEITFKVKKSWIEENGVTTDSITLLRLVGTEWVPLDTELAGEDGGNYLYSAKTPGFSYFAISSLSVEQKQKLVEEQKRVEEEESGEEQGAAEQPPVAPSRPKSWLGWVIALVVVVALIVGGFALFRHHKNQ